jgi:hypothetical protein
MADADRKPGLIQFSEYRRPAFSVFKTEKPRFIGDISQREAGMQALGGICGRAGATPGFVRPGRPKPLRDFRSQSSLLSLGRSRPFSRPLPRANQKTLVAGRLPGLVADMVAYRYVVADPHQDKLGLAVDPTREEKPWR